MNDTMGVQRVLSPLSPTRKVRRFGKEHPDSKKRSFEGDLDEEKDGEKNEKQKVPLQMAKTSDKRVDPGATVGTLVDIRA